MGKILGMKIYVRIAILTGLLLPFQKIEAQLDTVMHQVDGIIEVETDPTTAFFQSGEKIKLPAKTILITKTKKTITLAAFLKNDDMMYSDNVLADLDSDGKNELLISNFTGGAHCCDEIYIFKNIGLSKYQQTAKLFAGNTAISKDKLFTYNFYEQFGYFFTCFACAYTDTSDAAPVETESITLKYTKGKLNIIPGDKELRSTINDNLSKLGELPYEKLDDDLTQDSGMRKAFAMNVAVFYYSFGKNLAETQKLFNKYYKFPDAKKVWAAFVKEIGYISLESSL